MTSPFILRRRFPITRRTTPAALTGAFTGDDEASISAPTRHELHHHENVPMLALRSSTIERDYTSFSASWRKMSMKPASYCGIHFRARPDEDGTPVSATRRRALDVPEYSLQRRYAGGHN